MPGQMEVSTSGKLEDLLRWAETKICLPGSLKAVAGPRTVGVTLSGNW